MEIVQGPDFATGGLLVDSREVISSAYESGRGAMRVRARFSTGRKKDDSWEKNGLEKLSGGTWQLVVSEIPYQVQKGKLIEQIAQPNRRQGSYRSLKMCATRAMRMSVSCWCRNRAMSIPAI